MDEKKAHMPEVTDFDQFFTNAKQWKTGQENHRILILDGNGKHAEVATAPRGEFMRVGNYLSVRDGEALYVEPTEMLFEFIKTNFLFIAYDTIHYEIIDWGGGEGLLTVSHSQIIGSRWMTKKLKMATIPSFEPAVFDVRTGLGSGNDDGTFTDTIETIQRMPRQNSGYQTVRYKGKRYKLWGGIRTNWYINLQMPTGKG